MTNHETCSNPRCKTWGCAKHDPHYLLSAADIEKTRTWASGWKSDNGAFEKARFLLLQFCDTLDAARMRIELLQTDTALKDNDITQRIDERRELYAENADLKRKLGEAEKKAFDLDRSLYPKLGAAVTRAEKAEAKVETLKREGMPDEWTMQVVKQREDFRAEAKSLTAEVERLRGALTWIADQQCNRIGSEDFESDECPATVCDRSGDRITEWCFACRARAALNPTDETGET